MFYLAIILLVFTSCEKEAMEFEVMNAQFQKEVNEQKAHLKNVQSFEAHFSGDQQVPITDTDATGQVILN